MVAIFFDFVLYKYKGEVKGEKRSFVETGSMLGFYIIFSAFIQNNIGTIQGVMWGTPIIIIGTFFIALGAIINIVGRLNLKGNWANQIKIYKEHTVVKSGPYRFVRHPLYSSIILMLYGGAILYFNWICFLLVTIVFVPAMIYRSKQEENMLEKEFEEYKEYKEKVGMLFPKWRCFRGRI
ncbi:MAG: isoprenylcysteine carboxylmethyltransferase family protein [Bacillota bacterium]